MRTAESIERDKAAKADGEPTQSNGASDNAPQPAKRRGRIENLKPWKPGQSGNPGGKPKVDVARLIAQAIFEKNAEAAYAGLAKALLKGNAYVFKELADRGYGKVTDKLEVSGTETLAERIAAARKRNGK